MSETWKTRNGQVIEVKDMANQHIANTMAMLERNAKLKCEFETMELYSIAAWVQGDMVSDDLDRVILTREGDKELWKEYLPPIYKAMKKELKKRKKKKKGVTHWRPVS